MTSHAGEREGWGSPEFVAQEEMGRFSGYWMSPDGKKLAFVVEGDRVRIVEVESGGSRGGEVTIRAGLQGGETVVLSPPEGLADGDRIRIKGKS